MIEVDVPMLAVEDLPSYGATVTAWRSSRGVEARTGHTARSIRRHRLAWSPSEAADIAGISVRTLHAWVKEDVLAWASFVSPKDGIEKPRFCAADVLVARMSYDILEAGLTRHVAARCASAVGTVFCYDPYQKNGNSFSDLLGIGDRWLIPTDDATADRLDAEYLEAVVVFNDPTHYDHPEDRDGRQLEEHPDLLPHLIEYPVTRRVHELERRAASWWAKVGTPARLRPPWLT